MKQYDIIYADPPWRYEHPVSNSRRIENQYPTMSLDEIKALKIPAKDNSVLFLWATAPKLEEALQVMNSWGFIYRSNLIWDKRSLGMGYWFRNQHELLLVGVRGKFSPPSNSQRISSVFKLRRNEHSRKPSIIRDLISRWYPNMEKLEMFTRETIKGWDRFGNEIQSDVIL